MADTIISPNMNLPVPVVGVDSGPDWANNLNSCLSLIDSHNHASGNGVQITPTGLNINIDLPMNGNNLTLIRSSRYQAQSALIPASSPDINCTYVSGVDLYYNDGSGNQVRITQSGGVAGSPGSISNLTSPASASYVSGNSTFVWQSAASTPANMDGGSFIVRNVTASSNGITISPVNSLGSNYNLILPLLPSVKSFMALDNSGNITAPWSVDNSTLAISGSNVIVKPNGITATQIANATITSTQIAAQGVAQSNIYIKTSASSATAGNIAISSSTGIFSTATTSPALVPNLLIGLITTGRPVLIFLTSDGSGNATQFAGTTSGGGTMFLYRDGAPIQQCFIGTNAGFQRQGLSTWFDIPSAGSHTYQFYGSVVNGGERIVWNYLIMGAYEIN